MQPRLARRPGRWRGRARKPGRRGRLDHAAQLDEGLALCIVGMSGSLAHRQDRGKTRIRAFHRRAPIIARSGQEQSGQLVLQQRPARGVELGVEIGIVRQSGKPAQFGIELRFDRADRHVLAIQSLVGIVKMRAGIQQVDAAFVTPAHGRAKPPDHAHQQRRSIGHRAVDDLAMAGRARTQQARHHPERQQHAPAAEIADQVDRRSRFLAGAAAGVQCAGQRDVIDVVPGGLGQRPVLAPPGHPAVDQPRVVREQDIGAQAVAFHHARAKALDQPIGSADEFRAPGRHRRAP